MLPRSNDQSPMQALTCHIKSDSSVGLVIIDILSNQTNISTSYIEVLASKIEFVYEICVLVN